MYSTYADAVKNSTQNTNKHNIWVKWQSPRNPIRLRMKSTQTLIPLMQNKFHALSKLTTGEVTEPKQKSQLTLCLWNAQSLRHKTQLTKSYVDENEIDLYFIVETWLSNDETAVIGELEDEGRLRLINKPRHGRSGGGLCCLHKASLNVKNQMTVSRATIEIMETSVEIQNNWYTIVTIYRPGASAKNRYSMDDFFTELTEVLTYYNTYKNEVIFVGDFNIHVNKPADPNAKKLSDLLDLFDLHQHITEPTHQNGNTLDLVITKKISIVHKCVVDDMNSDHSNVLIYMNTQKAKPSYKSISTRKYKKINIPAFKKDIANHLSENVHDLPETLDGLIEKYLSVKTVLDKHAPCVTQTVRDKKPTPWLKADIKEDKIKKRRLEKKWKRSKLQSDLQAYKEQRNKYNISLNNLREKYLSDLISKNRGNSREMFKALNYALHRKVNPPLPPHDDDTALANDFSDFFDEKISKIRSELDRNNPRPFDEMNTFNGTKLTDFREMTQDEVKVILNKMSKSCKLDPLPLWLVKECIDEFLPIVTNIINLSLTQGEVPLKLKHAVVKPLLKKLDLDLVMKNYRPVSNLPFLGKALEAAVIMQYEEHLKENNLADMKQSAYKKYHSTETLLLKINNDIMASLDKGEAVMLVLLDLSAAFDTIDHNIMLDRLNKKYGIEGTALKWFESYLQHRTQSVLVNDKESLRRELKCGVPQGSKLGPVLFNAYIAPLSNVAKKNGVIDQKYADDEQLILSFKPESQTDTEQAFAKMEKCIDEIRTFLHDNKLCNNGDKTEFMLIGSTVNLQKLKSNSINVNNTCIRAVDKVKNLGVIFDKNMTMEKQVNSMCKKAFYNIKNVAHIRKSLSKNDTKTAIHALVTPHLDYGNALLFGVNKKLLDKLQIVQNSAARLIERLKKHDRISHVREQLHWLPVDARIKFKILNITWKALNDKAPKYLQDLLTHSASDLNLRSNNKKLLKIPRVCNKYGERGFSYTGPTLWNSLPYHLRNINCNALFRNKLKTHLFHNSYQNP